MTDEKVRRLDGERGASLILAIAFMVIVGAIGAAVLATTSSGLLNRVALDQARNREYAADAAIETTVVAARNLTSPGCPPPATSPFNLDNVPGGIHVDCSAVLTVIINPADGTPKLQTNLSLSACLWTGSGPNGAPCGTSSNATIVAAQVNFQGNPVTTYIQSWSVNR